MNWILFAFALELGAIQGPDIPVDLSSYVQMESTATILTHLEVGGALRSYQVPYTGHEWSPFRMDYTVHATVTFGMISFGVEHMCYHPVSTTSTYSWQSGGLERWFIRVVTTR